MIVMPVTDEQVAVLRALLRDDMDRYRQLFDGLDREQANKGYPALVTAAFIEAVERRFGTTSQPADIVMFVADVRSRSDLAATELDPDAAERVILAVLDQGTTRGLPREAVSRAKLVLLAGLISDANPDEAGLDEFLASARKLADQLMS
jgi:predicted nucleic acid-binding protein